MLRKQKKQAKAKQQDSHARRRFMERYNLRYSDFLYQQILQEIQSGRAKCVRKQSIRVSIFDVEIKPRKADLLTPDAEPTPVVIRCVYDRSRKTLATVLPKHDKVHPKPYHDPKD